LSADDQCIPAHDREQNYLLPFAKVFGQVKCLVNSKPLAVGQAEHSWKATKRNKSGKGANLRCIVSPTWDLGHSTENTIPVAFMIDIMRVPGN
jgi:hypothetical protein